MVKETVLIIVPGLGDKNFILDWEIKRLQRRGIKPQLHEAPWRTKKEPYQVKLKRLLKTMDSLSTNGHPLALLGISAAASLIENAYWERKNDVKAVISVCGRLRAGKWVFPPLGLAARDYKAFKESVLDCEQIQTQLTDEDKRKMLVLRAWFDELVPSSTSTLSGVQTITMPIIFHNPGITLALTHYSDKILDFITKAT